MLQENEALTWRVRFDQPVTYKMLFYWSLLKLAKFAPIMNNKTQLISVTFHWIRVWLLSKEITLHIVFSSFQWERITRIAWKQNRFNKSTLTTTKRRQKLPPFSTQALDFINTYLSFKCLLTFLNLLNSCQRLICLQNITRKSSKQATAGQEFITTLD